MGLEIRTRWMGLRSRWMIFAQDGWVFAQDGWVFAEKNGTYQGFRKMQNACRDFIKDFTFDKG